MHLFQRPPKEGKRPNGTPVDKVYDLTVHEAVVVDTSRTHELMRVDFIGVDLFRVRLVDGLIETDE